MQGEVDATRFDIAARVDGRVAEIPVVRGQNVAADAVLVRIDNPETVAKHEQAIGRQGRRRSAAREYQRRHARGGHRGAQGRARAGAGERCAGAEDLSIACASWRSMATRRRRGSTRRPIPCTRAERAVDQAKSAYEQAVNGYTREEHEIAEANVGKALADIKAVQSIIDQMVVYAPVASQVYQRNVEPGEYVSPGVPLVTLIDLSDLWIHFDLREDLVKTLKVGDRFDVRIPALGDRRITVEVKLIATKGEYASWRATRATGDFDLRTFSIRAYPVDKVPELRPGMSAYLDWRMRE